MAKLIGMKAIAAHVKRSESTVLGWIRDMGFPATKLGGIWEAAMEDIEHWDRDQKALASGPARAGKRQKDRKVETLV